MPPQHAAERVRRRLQEWVRAEGHGSKQRLARAVPAKYGESRTASWVTDVLKGLDAHGQDVRLRDLDAIADVLDVPPGDLVRRDHDHYVEVTSAEMRLLRFYRALPDTVRHHWMGWIDYVARFMDAMLDEQRQERDRRTAAAKAEHAAKRKKLG